MQTVEQPRAYADAEGVFATSYRHDWLLVALLVAAGLVLRWPGFRSSLLGDELSTFFLTGQSIGGLLHLLNGHSVDLTPPLYFVLTHEIRAIAGLSVQSLRAVSLAAGLIAIPLSYVLGRMTLGRGAGLVAAVLVTVSPYLIYYSTEARAYALMMCLSLASTVCLLRATEDGRARWWIGYAACACAVLYSHYTGVFVLAAQCVWALLTQQRLRRAVVLATAAATVGFLPWLPVFFTNSRSPGTKAIGELHPFGFDAIRFDLGRWLFGGPLTPLRSEPGHWVIALICAGLLIGGISAIRGSRGRPERTADRSALALLVALALATPVGLALWSMVSDSVWDLRDLIASTPALAVLIGALVTSGPRPVAATACALLLSGFAIAGGEMLKHDQQRLDYLTAARYIAKSGQPGDPAVEAVFFTPGPATELEAALALQPGHAKQQHAVIRLGLPPLSAVLAAPPYAHLPIPDGNTIARRAIQDAAHGTIYFVTTGGPTLAALRAVRSHPGSLQNTNLGQFLHALPPSFRLVRWRRFTHGYVPVSVYKIVGQRPAPLNQRPSV